MIYSKNLNFRDSSEPVDSEVSWVVVQGRSFWYLESRVLAGLVRRFRNVRLAALDLREISGVYL